MFLKENFRKTAPAAPFIKTKKKGIISIVYYQGKIFKRFKEKEKFIKLVSQLGIHKTMLFLKLMFLNCVKKTLNY